MKRILPPFLVVLGLALFGGFAYLTQHPESPYLERVQEWPVVGGLASSFREAYLGPDGGSGGSGGDSGGRGSSQAGSSRTEVVVIRLGPDGKPLTEGQLAGDEPIYLPSEAVVPSGGPRAGGAGILVENPSRTPRRDRAEAHSASSFKPGAAVAAREAASFLVKEWAWFLPGQTIHTAPDAEAEPREHLVSMAWLPVLGHRGSCVEVLYEGERGWIDTSWEPPYRRKGARRGLLRHRQEPVQSSDWGDLVRARKILGIKKPTRKLGDYELLTDVEDEGLLDFLDTAAVAAEEAYFARFGRLPSGDPGRTVVLFGSRDRYRDYAGNAQLVSDSHVGHARTGILALYAEGRSREELGRTLVHEIGHLLNDRALARQLPSWLEEGLATDLGSVWVEDPSMVIGVQPAVRRSLWLQGPESHLLYLAAPLEAGELPSISTLVRLDYETFHKEERIEEYAYAHSVALVRYLLDGESGRHAEGFREFLKRIAGGRGADPELLLKLLDVEMEELDRGFQGSLRREIQVAEQRLDERYRRKQARRRARR